MAAWRAWRAWLAPGGLGSALAQPAPALPTAHPWLAAVGTAVSSGPRVPRRYFRGTASTRRSSRRRRTPAVKLSGGRPGAPLDNMRLAWPSQTLPLLVRSAKKKDRSDQSQTVLRAEYSYGGDFSCVRKDIPRPGHHLPRGGASFSF
ncbi:hypothetical protein Micbo1qcDRAFT_194916 [Microdochium bolleyi]|uniref:Uncharacterized protein n=1 Tax=Microdochium bolleyi TaxID=196109 RepID=A0A136J4A9_9PEZI|nr:hypothetical protein Micbo1qcDRAFT_194916 [Microdochium bolleyi]